MMLPEKQVSLKETKTENKLAFLQKILLKNSLIDTISFEHSDFG
jgi:hypothetical protein